MHNDVIRADESHIDALLPLFCGYREFYEQPADASGARNYLLARLRNDECVVFLSPAPGEARQHAGFVLLYGSFDSVEMMRIWILHDLFVDTGFRGQGVGRKLMNAARDFCARSGASRIELSTAVDNKTAQALYESLGYSRESDWFFYSIRLAPRPGKPLD